MLQVIIGFISRMFASKIQHFTRKNVAANQNCKKQWRQHYKTVSEPYSARIPSNYERLLQKTNNPIIPLYFGKIKTR
jgi:hypothetical protein